MAGLYRPNERQAHSELAADDGPGHVLGHGVHLSHFAADRARGEQAPFASSARTPLWSVTEVDPTCLAALGKAFHPRYAPRHIFGAIEERLPVKSQHEIQKTIAPKEAWTEVKRVGYVAVAKLIQMACQDVPLACNHFRCHVHPDLGCPVRRQGFHPVDDRDLRGGDVRVCTAGIICKDVSAYGLLQADAGKSMTSQHVAVQERLHAKESLVMMECTKLWIPEALVKACQSNSLQ